MCEPVTMERSRDAGERMHVWEVAVSQRRILRWS